MCTHSVEDWVDGRIDGQHHNGHPGIGLQNHVCTWLCTDQQIIVNVMQDHDVRDDVYKDENDDEDDNHGHENYDDYERNDSDDNDAYYAT